MNLAIKDHLLTDLERARQITSPQVFRTVNGEELPQPEWERPELELEPEPELR